MRPPLLLAGCLAVLVASAGRQARANPVPLPFTYIYDTLPKGEGEVEQYVDFTPVRAISSADGHRLWYGASQFQTEYEYGLSDHLELGLYVTINPTPPGITDPAELTEGTGMKERLRLRLFEPGTLPIDVGLYGELVENDRELELEAKVILEKRFGPLRIASNLWAEREYEMTTSTYDWVLNPTLGFEVQLSPMVHLGLEGWMRGEWPDVVPAVRAFELGPHEFVGPTLMLEWGKLWWTTGVYARVDQIGSAALPDDNYGPMWVRSIIGVSL